MLKLTELIRAMNDALKENGEMNIAICVDGEIRDDIEINCVDNTLYIEGYRMEE